MYSFFTHIATSTESTFEMRFRLQNLKAGSPQSTLLFIEYKYKSVHDIRGRRDVREALFPGGTNSQTKTGYTVRVFHNGLSTENLKQSQNAPIHKTGGLFI